MKELGTPETPFPRPSIKFVYCEHTAANAFDVWQEVKDADIILVENISSELNRKTVEQTVNGYRTGNLENRLAAMGTLTRLPNPFLRFIFLQTAYAGKEMRSIDVTRDHPIAKEWDYAWNDSQVAGILFSSGFADEAEKAFKEYFTGFAAANSKREDFVIRQIEELQEKNKFAWAGKKIAVIQGSAHSLMYRKYKAMNPDQKVDRVMPSRDYRFTPEMEIERRLNFNPSAAIDEVLCKRAMLASFIISPELARMGMPESLALKLINDLSRRFDDGEIERLWGRIVKAQIQPRDLEFSKPEDEFLFEMKILAYDAAIRYVTNAIFG